MKIVAIGGGEIGRPGYPVETTRIDKEIIALTGKKRPKLLFLPTASHDSQGYVETVQKHFGKKLGCSVDSLLLWGRKASRSELEKKILSADIIYVGGGNTMQMIRRWKETGVDKALQKAMSAGKVLSGVSAGAICWFKYGNSDSRKFANPTADYIRVTGLNFVPLMLGPHLNEEGREPSLKRMLKKRGGIAVALDNCTAIKIIDDSYWILTSKTGAGAYKCYWSKGKYYKKKLEVTKEGMPLSGLLTR